MIKCDWIYCKHNMVSGICKLENITLKSATFKDLVDEEIITNETEINKENCSNLLVCEQYETMD